MNDSIVNNIIIIVKQDIIRKVISDMVLDMVRSIVWEEMTILREEVRSELQSFYERILTLIESFSTHHAHGPSSPPPPP